MGYTKDDNNELVIVPDEAKIVKKIFALYLKGYGAYSIAKILESEDIITVTGNKNWHSATIYKMLKCEKYIGDALLQKTYTIDFLTHKKVENNGQIPQYYIKNNHEPIISRKDFKKVQDELKRKNKNKKKALSSTD